MTPVEYPLDKAGPQRIKGANYPPWNEGGSP